MFEKILVATDGSDNADAAVQDAVELARLAGSKAILIVHVCSGCTTDVDPEGINLGLAHKIVERAAARFKGVDAEVSTRVETDYPPESLGTAVVEVADQEKPDVIVIGSRGLSEFRGMLLGSVSSKVVQHAKCPVLVIKKPEEG
jgi:nucleotide-binding universal stress UspA family protein